MQGKATYSPNTHLELLDFAHASHVSPIIASEPLVAGIDVAAMDAILNMVLLAFQDTNGALANGRIIRRGIGRGRHDGRLL